MVFVFTDNTEWVNETPKTLWKKIVDEVQDYFRYTLDW
jgi:protein TIF31